MNREDRIKLAIDKGYTCNPETGEVFGMNGRVITSRTPFNYILIGIIDYNKKHYNIRAHQFIWYSVYNEIVDCIDHINGIKDDNRIENLRSVTFQKNTFNTKAKGYSFRKDINKWVSRIMIDNKLKHLGFFDTIEEASQAYQDEKKILHII